MVEFLAIFANIGNLSLDHEHFYSHLGFLLVFFFAKCLEKNLGISEINCGYFGRILGFWSRNLVKILDSGLEPRSFRITDEM